MGDSHCKDEWLQTVMFLVMTKSTAIKDSTYKILS